MGGTQGKGKTMNNTKINNWEQDMYDELIYGDHSCFSEDFRPQKDDNEEGMIPIVIDFVEKEDEDLPF